MSYHPEMQPAIIRVERDEKYIATLAVAVEAFSLQLEAKAAGLRGGRQAPALAAKVPAMADEELL
jgi:hypothetical protein